MGCVTERVFGIMMPVASKIFPRLLNGSLNYLRHKSNNFVIFMFVCLFVCFGLSKGNRKSQNPTDVKFCRCTATHVLNIDVLVHTYIT